MSTKQKLHVYLVSDASGETVAAVGEAACRQFLSLEAVEYLWPLVRSKDQVDDLIRAILQNPGIILHSLLTGDIRSYLLKQCKIYAIPHMCPVEGIVSLISSYTKLKPDKTVPGKYSYLDKEYLRKIDSINFAMIHDDGQNIEDYRYADIVILGVSRTSKSPTSFYLAHRGYKVANLPIVRFMDYDYITQIKSPFLVGFTISPRRLLDIRRSRFVNKNNESGCYYVVVDDYLSLSSIQDEINYSNMLFKKYNCFVIDITNKAIEEIAAEVISLYCTHRGSHQKIL